MDINVIETIAKQISLLKFGQCEVDFLFHISHQKPHLDLKRIGQIKYKKERLVIT